jgi:cytochrome P450 family 135
MTKTGLPPGPGPSRTVNMVKWMGKPAQLLESSRKQYGDMWTLRLLGSTVFVFVSDPDLIEPFFTADPYVLRAGAAHQRIGTALLGKGSLLLLDEPDHMEIKDLLSPPFKRDHVERYREGIARVTEEEIESWPLGEPISMLPRMQRIALNVIMTTTFGGTTGADLELLRDRIRNLITWAENPVHMGHLHLAHRFERGYPKGFIRVRDELNESLYAVIKRYRDDPALDERDDVLALMIRSRREDGSSLSDQQLRDQLVTLMMQGHTSTATALAWALERITRHPEVMEKLRAEAESGDEEKYLYAVVQESLRARPPLPIAGAREVNEPFELGEYEIPKDTLVAACIWLLHQNEKLYPEPEKFRPERFLDPGDTRWTWIPFGGGHRSCIGASLALTQMKIVLKTLALRTRLEPPEQAPEKAQRRGVGFSPQKGGQVIVRERVRAAKAVAA